MSVSCSACAGHWKGLHDPARISTAIVFQDRCPHLVRGRTPTCYSATPQTSKGPPRNTEGLGFGDWVQSLGVYLPAVTSAARKAAFLA